MSLSYCEYSGVTYDLRVINMGGTYDLVDQLPSNREFGHFLVVSQSQVPREFGVNLALPMKWKSCKEDSEALLGGSMNVTN